MNFDEARIAGLGVFLIRTLMDEVSYDVSPQTGTDLLMVKRLPGPTDH
jgi:anti-sigma regulatory factor (Ser/Thr protein kinase)